MQFNVGDEVEVRHTAIGPVVGVVADRHPLAGILVYGITATLANGMNAYVIARASQMSPVNRLAEIEAAALEASVYGDDRPAPDGDAFETWLLRLLADPAKPADALSLCPIAVPPFDWDRNRCPNRRDCDDIRQYDCTGCDGVTE